MATISKVSGDIFAQIGYEIVFAVDATYKCDVGICKHLNAAYDVENILKQCGADSKWEGKGYCVSFQNGAQALNALVVKALPNHIPEYENIKQALSCLAAEINHCGSIITRRLAIPKICCGDYDKRDWNKIQAIIEEVFADVDCEILLVE